MCVFWAAACKYKVAASLRAGQNIQYTNRQTLGTISAEILFSLGKTI
jgi:hypothetical protein